MTASYTIASNYWTTGTPTSVKVLHDKPKEPGELLRVSFNYSCDALATHIQELKNLQRPLLRDEKDRLVSTLQDLLELSSLLEEE